MCYDMLLFLEKWSIFELSITVVSCDTKESADIPWELGNQNKNVSLWK